MNDFLPKDYKRPETPGDYMKLKLGSHTLRIVTAPIMGFEGWTEEEGNKKPVRRQDATDFADTVLEQAPKFFWGVEVYNYAAKRLQMLTITQSTILDKIELLSSNPQWGNPNKYDLVITRTGEGLETKYDVQSNPPTEMNNEIIDALAGKRANLQRWFDGGDAYDKDSDISTDPAGEQAAQSEMITEPVGQVVEPEIVEPEIGGSGVDEEPPPATEEPTQQADETFR